MQIWKGEKIIPGESRTQPAGQRTREFSHPRDAQAKAFAVGHTQHQQAPWAKEPAGVC